MATGYATANLGFRAVRHDRKVSWLDLLLRFETWLDRRETSRALYEMDDRTLSDIGLSRADVEELNVRSWEDYLPPAMGR